MIILLLMVQFNTPASIPDNPTPIPIQFGTEGKADLPPTAFNTEKSYIVRGVVFDTQISDNRGFEVVDYTVNFGDSLFGISDVFKITPETLLWANEEILSGNPDFLAPGMNLKIPPINGVYYQWQSGDSLTSVATSYEAEVDDIINWGGNPSLDLTNPVIEPGSWIMIPEGKGEFKQWIIPTIPRGSAGVSSSLYGPGACEGNYTGVNGSGNFIWPTSIHNIVGNDYWDGHLGLDIAADESIAIVASDSGVVVFSGWANGGYGYMVMIDHGNGYQTLYGHNSQVTALCGASVSAGQTIAFGGSSGNSSGPHVHFEIRLLGGFVNPWFVLPAP